jgi:hypothetical protein
MRHPDENIVPDEAGCATIAEMQTTDGCFRALPSSSEGKGNIMKIAVSSTGPDLFDLVDPRFGRCRFYIVCDPDTGFQVAKENTATMH